MDIPEGVNYVQAAFHWRCFSPVRAIEWWLSRDCCLSDFPGYVLQRASSNIGSEFRSLTEFLFWQLRRNRLIALISVLDVVGFSVAVPLWRRP